MEVNRRTQQFEILHDHYPNCEWDSESRFRKTVLRGATKCDEFVLKYSKHEKLLKLTTRPTVILNMIGFEGTVRAENEVEPFNSIPAYRERRLKKILQRNMTKE